MQNRIGTKIVSNYLNKKRSMTTAGISICDYNLLNKDNVKLVFSSSDPIELLTARNLVFNKFDYSMIPVNETFASSKQEDGMFQASIIAHRSPMKVKDVQTDMTKISANSYLDEKVGDIWEKQEIEGKEYFVRNNDEDIAKILEAIAVTAGRNLQDVAPRWDVGTTVDVYVVKDGKPVVLSGKVKQIKGQTVVVMVNRQAIEVPSASIIKAYSDAGERNEVVDFLKKAYNPPNADFDYGSLFNK
jgi:hypothetical protein